MFHNNFVYQRENMKAILNGIVCNEPLKTQKLLLMHATALCSITYKLSQSVKWNNNRKLRTSWFHSDGIYMFAQIIFTLRIFTQKNVVQIKSSIERIEFTTLLVTKLFLFYICCPFPDLSHPRLQQVLIKCFLLKFVVNLLEYTYWRFIYKKIFYCKWKKN